MKAKKFVAVFAGSNDGNDPEFTHAARRLGQAIAEAGANLVYGGGRSGLMGLVADGALEAGGFVLGLIPKMYGETADIHAGISEVRLLETVEQRKRLFGELAAFSVAVPGGVGTLDEIADALNANAHAASKKPCALLNVNGYYEHMRGFFDQAHRSGMISDPLKWLLFWDGSAEALIAHLLDEPVNK